MVTALETIRQRSLEVLRGVLGPAPAVALLDFPSHKNAGDTLIYLGERAYLRQLGVDVAYLSDIVRYQPDILRQHLPEGPILITGGGNLGDRWHDFTLFKEQVVRDFPDRTIIQLPQSIDFTDTVLAAQTREVFADHPDLTVLIRESVSMERATRLLPGVKVQSCPDMAFGLGRVRRVEVKRAPIVSLMRDDHESLTNELGIAFSNRTDWKLLGADRLLWKAVRVPQSVVRRAPGTGAALYPVLERAYERQARMNFRSAVRILSGGEILVTDRLHAMVLGALCAMPVIAMDNANGKVAAVYNDYLQDFPHVHFVESYDQVHDTVAQISAA